MMKRAPHALNRPLQVPHQQLRRYPDHSQPRPTKLLIPAGISRTPLSVIPTIHLHDQPR